MGDECLFEEEILQKLSHWHSISSELAQRGLIARSLRLTDYDKGYLDVLSQLTTVGRVTKQQFVERFQRMKASNQIKIHYIVVVIEDTATNKLVGTSTLFLELKFIHECTIRGRLEDVAVLDSYRGHRIGELVVRIIVDLACEIFGCYKLSLDCSDDLVKFYSKNNFVHGSNMLCIRFDH